MADSQDFREIQYAFARHIRDPDNNPAPTDAEDRRQAIYRELFFNNLRNLISQTFPVLKKLHSKEKWANFIRQFMVRHEAQTPYFLEIPKEFLAFLENIEITPTTTTRDPDTFDWEPLKTPFNPFPPDIGPVDSSKGFTIAVSNLTGAASQMFQATFFGAIGGYAGLKYLKEHVGLSDKLYGLLSNWLRESGITPDSSSKG